MVLYLTLLILLYIVNTHSCLFILTFRDLPLVSMGSSIASIANTIDEPAYNDIVT